MRITSRKSVLKKELKTGFFASDGLALVLFPLIALPPPARLARLRGVQCRSDTWSRLAADAFNPASPRGARRLARAARGNLGNRTTLRYATPEDAVHARRSSSLIVDELGRQALALVRAFCRGHRQLDRDQLGLRHRLSGRRDLGGDRPAVQLQRHLAIGDQHRHHGG